MQSGVVVISFQSILGSIVVSISACHAEDPGSIPGRGGHSFFLPTRRAHLRPLKTDTDFCIVQSSPSNPALVYPAHFLAKRIFSVHFLRFKLYIIRYSNPAVVHRILSGSIVTYTAHVTYTWEYPMPVHRIFPSVC